MFNYFLSLKVYRSPENEIGKLCICKEDDEKHDREGTHISGTLKCEILAAFVRQVIFVYIYWYTVKLAL